MPFVSSKRLEALLLAGTRMSNICYNLAQHSDIESQHRSSMKESQTEWDSARRELFASLKPKES